MPMSSFAVKFPMTSHTGHKVSHAKNRSKRRFKYNLHSLTLIQDGERVRMRVPTKVLRMLKKAGVTTHYRPEQADTATAE